MEQIGPDHPLRDLFGGLVEYAFCTEVGMCSPRLTEYLAELLVTFTHVDWLRSISHARGKRLDQIAAMLAVAMGERSQSRQERDRMMYRHIGDYTLFWAGVYPEQLKGATRKSSDLLLSFVSQGKKSYAIASELAGEDDVLPPSLFRHLSEDFEYCLYGLGLVRRAWEQIDRSGGHLVL